MTLANLSFETAADAPGGATGWTWTRAPAFLFAGFATPSGISRFEGFEYGWRMPSADLSVQNYPFVGALVAPSTAQALIFGSLSGTPSTAEGFERLWRMPGIVPFDDHGENPPDATHPGNETAFFVWRDTAIAAPFGAARTLFDDFESQWSADESYAWSFAPSALVAAPIETFSTGWHGNETYQFAMGALTPAVFHTLSGPLSFEDFHTLQADQPVTFVVSRSAVVVAVLPSSDGQLCTFYNAGDGSLPPEINPRSTYFVADRVLSGPGSPYFQISGGSGVIAFTGAGSGTNYVKADRTLLWTLSDVGV